jgi:hypothetical protein
MFGAVHGIKRAAPARRTRVRTFAEHCVAPSPDAKSARRRPAADGLRDIWAPRARRDKRPLRPNEKRPPLADSHPSADMIAPTEGEGKWRHSRRYRLRSAKSQAMPRARQSHAQPLATHTQAMARHGAAPAVLRARGNAQARCAARRWRRACLWRRPPAGAAVRTVLSRSRGRRSPRAAGGPFSIYA